MQRVSVWCDDPLNQVARIMDILRRMGAELISLDLKEDGENGYLSVIDYAFDNVAANETFLKRLPLIPGVEILESRPLVHLVGPDRADSMAAC